MDVLTVRVRGCLVRKKGQETEVQVFFPEPLTSRLQDTFTLCKKEFVTPQCVHPPALTNPAWTSSRLRRDKTSWSLNDDTPGGKRCPDISLQVIERSRRHNSSVSVFKSKCTLNYDSRRVEKVISDAKCLVIFFIFSKGDSLKITAAAG